MKNLKNKLYYFPKSQSFTASKQLLDDTTNWMIYDNTRKKIHNKINTQVLFNLEFELDWPKFKPDTKDNK